jgi:hypothetical protein
VYVDKEAARRELSPRLQDCTYDQKQLQAIYDGKWYNKVISATDLPLPCTIMTTLITEKGELAFDYLV